MTRLTPGSAAAAMLQEFHTRPGVDIGQPSVPTLVAGLMSRVGYTEQELRELREAVEDDDLTAVADALADLVYLCYGTAWRCGIPLDEVLEEVHWSNMTKTPSRGDGKAVKGPGYRPPDVYSILVRHGYQGPPPLDRQLRRYEKIGTCWLYLDRTTGEWSAACDNVDCPFGYGPDGRCHNVFQAAKRHRCEETGQVGEHG